jgi:Na+-driven multidrug efflux pump
MAILLLANASGIWASVLLAWVLVGRFDAGLPGAWLCFALVAPFSALAVWLRFRNGSWQTRRLVTAPAGEAVRAEVVA